MNISNSIMIGVIVLAANDLFDAIPLPRISFLWIDAQGVDWSIVKSLREDNLRRIDEMKFEFNVQPLSVGQNMGASVDSAIVYLERRGFSCFQDKQENINQKSQGYVDVRCHYTDY